MQPNLTLFGEHNLTSSNPTSPNPTSPHLTMFGECNAMQPNLCLLNPNMTKPNHLNLTQPNPIPNLTKPNFV